ncbi:TPA: hypothetical protein N0F65_009758 [Lagenidium giganteum]|uniref:Orn/DAP/Arg decarboxylase 2 N-terminal domain-containing protein n=1 Tax=Lagenidium giganteum TaxID=4803 RepID=A0AAV2YPD8_9STRA|nr:TPA: hypothetical protein N0F65_009758 [Lagenidium giganteum]
MVGTPDQHAVDPVVRQAALDHIARIGDDEEAFYTVDLRWVANQYQRMVQLLPRVQPFYTMKCNPDVRVFELLTGLGCGVDCASKPEIDFALQHGVRPDQIIYANTIKQKSHLQFAKAHNVALMVFDNVDELIKIHAVYPEAQLVLRIQVDDSKSRVPLGAKFGAPLEDLPEIFAVAKELSLNLMGVCFHVGVGCLCATAFTDAIKRSRAVFDMAEAAGFKLTLLNLGGGFAGDDLGPVTFEAAALAVNACLDELFPESSGVRIISEPGRYFVSACSTLNLNIIGRKRDPTLTARAADEPNPEAPRYMYFTNDGNHGSFSASHLFKLHAPILLATKSTTDPVPCSLWGPTCDGRDFITKDASLPVLSIGDWITFPHMGAYGFATGGTFNGFLIPRRIYIESEQ